MLLPPSGNISNLEKWVLEILKGSFYVTSKFKLESKQST